MKQFIINVPDEKRTFFEELMRNLDFSISENSIVSEPVPEWHIETVLSRIENTKGKEDYIAWEEAKKMIKRKNK